MTGTEIRRSLPESDWRGYLQSDPLANIFYTPEMYEVFRRARGFQPDFWAAVDSSRTLALFMPVQVRVLGKMPALLTTRSVAFGGILYEPSAQGQQAAADLLAAYACERSGGPLFTETRNLSDLTLIQPALRRNGFAYEDHLNYLVELAHAPKTIFEAFTPKIRKGIRHAIREDAVAVEEVCRREDLAAWYAVLLGTYQRARVPLPDISLFEAAFDILRPKGLVRFTQARIAGDVAAVSVELLHRKYVYGWYGGLDRSFATHKPNELLTWRILEWAARQGYQIYDFGGAGKPDQEYGVRDFKAKFGGRLVSFGRNTLIHRPVLLRISRLGYELLRRWL